MQKLQSLAPGVPVEQDTVSQEKANLHIWFERSNANQDTDLDGTPGLTDSNFNVEVAGLDIDAVQELANTLKAGLNGYRGAMGSDVALGCFVEDQADDYVSRSVSNTDEGIFISAFAVQVLH